MQDHNRILEALKLGKIEENHSKRVLMLSLEIAKRLKNVYDINLEDLEWASTLHDSGKKYIEEEILYKPSALTDEEMKRMREHVVLSSQEALGLGFKNRISEIILCHHERNDGSGYPLGRRDKDIPIEAKILAVADVFDALTSDRPYRKAYSVEVAFDIMVSDIKKYDTKVFSALIVAIAAEEKTA